MKFIDQILGKKDEVSKGAILIRDVLSQQLGREITVKQGKGYRTDENGRLWLWDVDPDEMTHAPKTLVRGKQIETIEV